MQDHCRDLLIQTAVYGIVGLYLHQVLPQQHGVQKHPLWFLESFLQTNLPSIHSKFFENLSHLESFRDKDELKEENEDVRAEKQCVD